MKRSTLLSTAAVLALSTTLALAEGAQREPRQVGPSNAPAAQQQTPPRTQNSESTGVSGSQQSQTPSSTQSSQAAPSGTANQSSQAQQQPSGRENNAANQPSSQQPANRNAEREPSQRAQNNKRAQQPSQHGNQNAQREQNDRRQNNAQSNERPSQRSSEAPSSKNRQNAQAPQSGQSRKSAQVSTEQRTRIASTIRQQNISPVRVNFALRVGVNVPSNVRLAVLPDTIVSIVPQYRGYSYFVTDEQIVIVEPSSHHIVQVMPYQGGSRTAAAPARSEQRAHFSSTQRDEIRRYATQKREATTTGSGSTRRIVVDEEVPATVVLEDFPETVVREVPEVRTYRYYRQDNDVVVVDPGSRRVIDVIE